MSVSREKVEGELRVDRIPKDLCWGKPEDFVKALTSMLGVTLFTNPGNDFVVVGHQTPANEDKGRLWVRTSRSGVFQGFYLFQGKTWKRIHNRRSDEIIWLTGDSRDIPEGFQLIVPGIGGILSAVVTHLVKQYYVDTAASGPTLTVYNYYAVRYIGTT